MCSSAFWGTISSWGLFVVAAFSAGTWFFNQKSARRTAAIEFLDSFTETPGARNAALMLSDRSREVPLWDKSDPAERYVRVEWREIKEAFNFDEKTAQYPFDSKSTAIRDSFNDFFGRLARVNILLRDGAINSSDAKHIMNHWIWVFSAPQSEADHIKQLFSYIKRTDLSNVVELFRRYNIKI